MNDNSDERTVYICGHRDTRNDTYSIIVFCWDGTEYGNNDTDLIDYAWDIRLFDLGDNMPDTVPEVEDEPARETPR